MAIRPSAFEFVAQDQKHREEAVQAVVMDFISLADLVAQHLQRLPRNFRPGLPVARPLATVVRLASTGVGAFVYLSNELLTRPAQM